MAETAKSQQAHRIDAAKDAKQQFLISPENKDLFMRTGKQVVEACQLGISVETWLQELIATFDFVRRWAKENQERIRSCYCSPDGGRVTFFVAPRSESFDFDIADDLAELNIQLIREFNVGRVEIHQIPWGEMDRFLTVEIARLVHGEAIRSHRAVEA